MRLAAVAAELDRRLEKHTQAPLIVAVSGGGDSLALMLIAADWARIAGRRLIAATVDHRLQPAGAAWARDCADRAGALGLAHRTLVWDRPKPTTGLPAAARAARHRLLADLARTEGAAVILMGHTADDVLEAERMRDAGASTPSPRAWAPSPAWPEGRGLFICRPLLTERRVALRAWVAARGETWIDDPANEDDRYARARARRALTDDGLAGAAPRSEGRGVGPRFEVGLAGELSLPRDAFTDADSRRRLAAAVACVSGRATPPRAGPLNALLARLATTPDVVATLGGARVQARHDNVTLCREPGEYRRAGPPIIALAPGVATVWDGRFEIATDRPGLTVRPLAGLAARLENDQLRALKACPPSVRGALPAIVDADGRVSCPILAQDGQVRIRSLVAGRFAAAVGAVENEGTIWRVAKCGQAS